MAKTRNRIRTALLGVAAIGMLALSGCVAYPGYGYGYGPGYYAAPAPAVVIGGGYGYGHGWHRGWR